MQQTIKSGTLFGCYSVKLLKLFFFAFVLLTAHSKKFSVSLNQDFQSSSFYVCPSGQIVNYAQTVKVLVFHHEINLVKDILKSLNFEMQHYDMNFIVNKRVCTHLIRVKVLFLLFKKYILVQLSLYGKRFSDSLMLDICPIQFDSFSIKYVLNLRGKLKLMTS